MQEGSNDPVLRHGWDGFYIIFAKKCRFFVFSCTNICSTFAVAKVYCARVAYYLRLYVNIILCLRLVYLLHRNAYCLFNKF